MRVEVRITLRRMVVCRISSIRFTEREMLSNASDLQVEAVRWVSLGEEFPARKQSSSLLRVILEMYENSKVHIVGDVSKLFMKCVEGVDFKYLSRNRAILLTNLNEDCSIWSDLRYYLVIPELGFPGLFSKELSLTYSTVLGM